MVNGRMSRFYKVQELIGEELSLRELDNKMQDIGFYSLLDDCVEENLSDGNAVYTSFQTLEREVQVFFVITIKNTDDEEASCTRVRITNVCKL